MKKFISLIIVILLLASCATDKESTVTKKVIVIKEQIKDNSILLGEEINIFSNVLNEERKISVYLPDSYKEGKATYPVLYLLDGETHFNHGSGAAQYMASQGVIPEMIVVAIHNIDRNRDLSPVHVERIPTSGGANKYLAYIADELIPYISENYRTSSYDVIFGHSFGGVFVTYALVEKPDLFDGYISISPYLQYADNHIVKEAEEKLLTDFKKDVYYYLCVGEEPAYYDAINYFSSVVDERSDPNFHYKFENFFIGEDHGTMPYIGLVKGLRYNYDDWRIPNAIVQSGLEAVDAYYQTLSQKYGVNARTTEALLNWMGYTAMGSGDMETALKVFKENVKRYPNSPNVYDSLGEAYEANGQLELAAENFKKAWELGEEQDHQFKALFKANYDRVNSEQ